VFSSFNHRCQIKSEPIELTITTTISLTYYVKEKFSISDFMLLSNQIIKEI